MDATVTAKYFRVYKPSAEAPSLENTLQNIVDREVRDREVELGDGIIMRLERFQREATYFIGEFCRVQRDNIPPSAGDDGLTPTVLAEGKGLGHVAAFRYHVPTRVLLLQINQQCGTATRISMYLGTADSKPLYQLEPVLRTDVLTRLGKAEVRAFTAKFAQPENIAALDDPTLSAVEGVRRAAEMLKAREITVTIAAGRKKRKEKKRPRLRQDITRRILSKLSKVDDVQALRAQISEEVEAKWVDLLEEQMKYSEKLDLPSNDPERNYEVRKRYLSRIFNANITELKKIYTDNNDDN